MKKGKLIVIDGTDGSGKATQKKMLHEKIESLGHKVASLDFPRYYDNFFGKFIGEALAGEYGDWSKIHPKIASVIYAVDRFESSQLIRDWLDGGYTVILDRYVSANQIHQGGKISDMEQRHEFMTWLDDMEHGVFSLPRPDLVLYLDMPVEISQKLLLEKNNQNSKKYLKGKADVHESDTEHLKSAQASAQFLADNDDSWQKINCAPDGKLLSREEIHKQIFEISKYFLKNQD